MGVGIMSTGWFLQLDRYFNVLYNIGISTLYKSIKQDGSATGNITHDEYLDILRNSWAGDHYTESDFREWVSGGYLTPDEFKFITNIDY